MSQTTTPDPLPTIPTPAPSPDTLYSQAFIYAMCMLPIAAGVLIGVFKYLSSDVAAALAGTALGYALGAPNGFFFGASKHPSAPTTPATTTMTTGNPPATVTTTTGPQQ